MKDFNPCPRRGSDACTAINNLGVLYFNPRSRRGSDGILRKKCGVEINFNPRSRRGSDSNFNQFLYLFFGI